MDGTKCWRNARQFLLASFVLLSGSFPHFAKFAAVSVSFLSKNMGCQYWTVAWQLSHHHHQLTYIHCKASHRPSVATVHSILSPEFSYPPSLVPSLSTTLPWWWYTGCHFSALHAHLIWARMSPTRTLVSCPQAFRSMACLLRHKVSAPSMRIDFTPFFLVTEKAHYLLFESAGWMHPIPYVFCAGFPSRGTCPRQLYSSILAFCYLGRTVVFCVST